MAQQEPWIALVRGPEYAVRAGGGEDVVRVPVRLATGIAPAMVNFALVDVRRDKRHGPDLMALFPSVAVEQPQAGTGPALLVTVLLAKAPGPGAYDLLIEASDTTGDRKPVLLELTLVHPTAKLRAAAPLVVERVTWPFGEAVDSTSLVLSETAGTSRLTDLTVTPLDLVGPNGGAMPGVFEATPPAVLDPRTTATVPITLRGDFPLGTTKGVLEVRGKQLETPFTLGIEVHTRRSRWLLIVAILGGLLMGYVLRTALQRSVEVKRAQLVIVTLSERLLDEEGSADSDFRTALEQIRGGLTPHLTATDAAAMTTAAGAATSALERARTALAARVQQAVQAIDAAARLLARDWMVPAELREAVRAQATHVETARARIGKGDARGALDAIGAARTAIASRVSSILPTWRTEAQLIHQELASHLTGLPEEVTNDLRTSAARLGERVSAVPDASAGSELATIERVLEAMHEATTDVIGIASQFRSWLRRSFHDFVMVLERVPAGLPHPFAKLERAVAEAEAALAAHRTASTVRAPLLPGDVRNRLDDGWRESVEARLVPGDQATRDLVRAALDARQFSRAARAVADAARDRAAAEGSPLGGESVETGPARVLEAMGAWLPDPVRLSAQPYSAGAVILPALPKSALAAARVRTFKELFIAVAAQTAVAGVGILVVGFFLFGPGFVGTGEDLAAAFLWGFGLDVTVNSFASLATEAGKPKGR